MRLFTAAAAALLLVSPAAAQEPKLDDVVARLARYVVEYGERLANVVAEELYVQSVTGGNGVARSRTLRSDYALTRVTGREAWVGYRDTFEVDGRPVRDREERLARLLASGDIGQAARIADQNARFNLASDLLSRNVNVPTFALELLQPRNQDRFSRRRAGTERVGAVDAWAIEFRERDRPTLVRTPEGRDQPTRIVALVDPRSGAVLRTTVTWERIRGSITVTYGNVDSIPVLVPTHMSERYATRDDARIDGDAGYSNYRQFQTSGRVLP